MTYNNSLQPTANPLRGLSAAELKRWAVIAFIGGAVDVDEFCGGDTEPPRVGCVPGGGVVGR